jgi:hypothetical protein
MRRNTINFRDAAVHLDPFQEKRRAYMFFSNPIGIQADGVTSEGSRDDSLVALDRRKHLSADVLMTYLVHPGTALYVGYTDGYDNLGPHPALPSGSLPLSGAPTTSTGRQVFVKSSYLFRF